MTNYPKYFWRKIYYISRVISLFLKKLLKSSFYLDLDLLLATIGYKPLHSIDTIQDDATTFVLFDVASDDHLAHKLSSFNVGVGPNLSLLDTTSQISKLFHVHRQLLLLHDLRLLLLINLSLRSSSLGAHLHHVGTDAFVYYC